jgi:hypothetical protein
VPVPDSLSVSSTDASVPSSPGLKNWFVDLFSERSVISDDPELEFSSDDPSSFSNYYVLPTLI